MYKYIYKSLKLLLFLWYILLTNKVFAEPVASGSATPVDANSCAPLTVQLKANQSDDIEDYQWKAVNGEIKRFSEGAISEILLDIPGNYTISLDVVDKEGYSDLSEIATIIVKELEDCVEVPPPKPLEACFNLTILEKTFGIEVLWLANKAPDDGLKVTLNAYCSTGNIESYKWDVSGEISYGNPSDITFDEAGTYMITLEITDIDGNTASESKQITIDILCAEFELPSEINFNEKFPLNVKTCVPIEYLSPIKWEIVSSDSECDKIKPIIGDGHIIFVEPSTGKSCDYTITLTVTDVNGVEVSASKSINVEGPPPPIGDAYFEIFKNGEIQSFKKKELKYRPEDTLKIIFVVNDFDELNNCGPSASLFIAVEIYLGCINPKIFLMPYDPFYSLNEKECAQPIFKPIFGSLYSENYPKPYKSIIKSGSGLLREVVIDDLDLKEAGANGQYIFSMWLVKEGTVPFDFKLCGDSIQPYERIINVIDHSVPLSP